MNYQTLLARAGGFGLANEGTRHWWRQRVTAAVLVPLALWFAFCVARLPSVSHDGLVRWMARPWNSVFLLAFIFLSLYHAMLGLQVVIDDYVHHDRLKAVGLLGVKLVLAVLALIATFAVFALGYAHG